MLRRFGLSVSLHARVIAAPPVATTAVKRSALQPIAVIGVPIVIVSDDDDAPVVSEGVFVLEGMRFIYIHGSCVGAFSVRRAHAIGMAHRTGGRLRRTGMSSMLCFHRLRDTGCQHERAGACRACKQFLWHCQLHDVLV